MSKKKIIVVEDEPAMRRMVSLELETAGYEVSQAEDGLSALALIKASLPDLIITDVLMPQMDGFLFYKELKKDTVTANVPVLILTARGKMEESFRVVGADDFIAKPFQSEALLEKVSALLNRPAAATIVKVQTSLRVLVVGTDSETVENMIMLLKRIGCHTDLVESGAQAISKAVLFLPQILIIEVQMDTMTAAQIIGVMRKMPQFETIPILTYSYYRLSELGSEDVRQKALTVDSCVSDCEDAGSTEYLGRFNQTTFLKQVGKYLT